MLANILVIAGIALLIFVLYRGIQRNPEAFSKVNLNKSFMTLGLLALLLIAVISFAVMLLK